MNQSPLLATIQRLHGDTLTMSSYWDSTWRLPAFYAAQKDRETAIAAEHAAITAADSVAVADRSWRAAVELKGRDRQSFLNAMVSNDVLSLTPGQGCRAAMLDPTAHLIADLVVVVLPDSILLITDPRCVDRLIDTLDKHLISEKVSLSNAEGRWCVVTVSGSEAAGAASLAVGPVALPATPHGSASGRDGILAVRSGERRRPSYDLWIPAADAASVWEALAQAGARPVGEEAHEVARIVDGDPAWGSELDGTVLLPETELEEAVSYRKGCYVGQEIVARIHARGHTNKSLRAVLFEPGEHSLQPGDPLYPVTEDFEAVREIGRVTSVAPIPLSSGRIYALAYVRREQTADDTPVVCRYAHREAYGAIRNVDAAR
jgi:tRNA-modifying protein YgfZ